jgi:hypothetical protein
VWRRVRAESRKGPRRGCFAPHGLLEVGKRPGAACGLKRTLWGANAPLLCCACEQCPVLFTSSVKRPRPCVKRECR